MKKVFERSGSYKPRPCVHFAVFKWNSRSKWRFHNRQISSYLLRSAGKVRSHSSIVYSQWRERILLSAFLSLFKTATSNCLQLLSLPAHLMRGSCICKLFGVEQPIIFLFLKFGNLTRVLTYSVHFKNRMNSSGLFCKQMLKLNSLMSLYLKILSSKAETGNFIDRL